MSAGYLLCMFCSAKTLSMVPGYDLENVTTLRSLDDAQSIAVHAAGKDVVIVGTSFIGQIICQFVYFSFHVTSL